MLLPWHTAVDDDMDGCACRMLLNLLSLQELGDSSCIPFISCHDDVSLGESEVGKDAACGLVLPLQLLKGSPSVVVLKGDAEKEDANDDDDCRAWLVP